jgi:hypothetical protein
VAQTLGAINGVTYTHSIYAKKGTNNFIQLAGTGGIYTAGNVFANFDLNNGVVGSVGAGSTATITNVGNGWYRCTMTATATATASGNAILICLVESATASRAEANSLTTNVFIWGAQLVEGTDAKPYFATTNRQDVPRIDFRNADGTLSSCGRLLLEPQRTNSMLYSQAINSWAFKTELTITDNNTISPDGTQNASYIQQTTGGNAVTFQSQNVNVTTGQIQTISFFAKAKEVTSVSFRLGGVTGWSGGVRPTFTCDLTNGTITLIAGTATVSSQNIGNGWYRFVIVTSAVLITTTTTLQTPTGAVFSPNSGDGFYLWGVQWEQNATYPTTYIPTTTAAVTRIADAASKTGVSSLIGQTEGTLFVDITLTSRSSFSYFAIAPNLGATNTYIGIGISASSISFEVVNSGIQVAYSFPNTSTGSFKLAFAYKANDFVAYVNGALVHTDTSGTVPTCSQIGLNAYNNAASWNYNQAALFPTRLTNAQLAQLTTL